MCRNRLPFVKIADSFTSSIPVSGAKSTSASAAVSKRARRKEAKKLGKFRASEEAATLLLAKKVDALRTGILANPLEQGASV